MSFPIASVVSFLSVLPLGWRSRWRGRVAGPRAEVRLPSTLSALLSRRGDRLLCLPGNFLLEADGKIQDLRLGET